MANTLPPMLQVMKDIGGIELPETIAKISGDEGGDSDKKAAKASSAVKARVSKPKPKAE
jgi:flotillin